MAEHTPGPWTRDAERDGRMRDESAAVRGPDGLFIAAAFDFNRTDRDAEVEANARLIAAAPELLAACLAYQDWTDASERAAFDNSMANLDAESDASDRFENLREAAIAKALGKEPPAVRVWISKGVAPIFVKLEGPMYAEGPTWRVELAAPKWD